MSATFKIFPRNNLPAAAIASLLALAHPAAADYGLQFTPNVDLGDTLGGAFGELVDFNSYTGPGWEFGLVASLQGSNPDLPISIELFSDDFSQKALYSGFTTMQSPVDTFLPLTLAVPAPGFDYSKVGGMQLTWDGSGPIDVFISHIAARTSNGMSRVNLAPLWAGAFLVEPDATTANYVQTPPPPGGGSFSASAPGGVLFLAGARSAAVGSRATDWSYAEIPAAGTSWSATSDSNSKTDITAVDHREVLRGLASLPVTAWKYTHDREHRHIGPMAQDFHGTFGLGHDDKRISTLDADGVALSALKGLIEELRERQRRSAAQAERLGELETQIRELHLRMKDSLPPAP